MRYLHPFPEDLFLLIHSRNAPPFSIRISPKRIAAYIFFLASTLFLLFIGTLLFFYELEVNRKLNVTLLQTQATPKTVAPPIEKIDVAAPEEETINSTTPKVSEFIVECQTERCEAILSLMPSHSGLSEGELLMILEVEMPRIGTGNPTQAGRKRFYFYPTAAPRDELSQEVIPQLETKTFRFTRALRTTASFAIGKLVRPIAMNLYLFDKSHVVIHHERKVIEGEEP